MKITDAQRDAMPDRFKMAVVVLIFCIPIAAMVVWT